MKPLLQRGGASRMSTVVGMSRWRRFVTRVDWPLWVAVTIVSVLGLLNLYSATYGTQHSEKFDQQVTRMIIGAGMFFAVSALDYRIWVRVAWVLFGLTVGALVLVAIMGALAKGSQRWLAFGPMRIQPSELVKVSVILVLAKMLQDADVSRPPVGKLAPQLALLGLPVVLIAAQPDLGSAVLVVMIVVSIGFLSLRNVWPAAGAVTLGLALVPVLWENMHEYQKQRVLAFLDPSADPTGAGWHTRQSIFAVGSGRITGKGFMEGTQNQFDFLPEHWTDFPFSVWAEEWGFAGAVVFLLLFAFLLFWTVNVAMVARDRAGAVICVGAGALLFWHMVVNIAMVLGMAPVVGVTLPLVSYGGSSLLVVFIALGLVSSVSMRRHGF